MSFVGAQYKIHEFAKLAGVTVKALHHYDRLGLLQPGWTEAGYRVYCEGDLETLEQIVALKFLGIPLKQIAVVLKRAAHLPDALRLQRRALEDKHALLGRAIRAIQAAEESLESGQPAHTAILKKIIEVINMQNDMQNDMQDGITVMKKYYSEEAWDRHRRYYEEGPSPEWRQLTQKRCLARIRAARPLRSWSSAGSNCRDVRIPEIRKSRRTRRRRGWIASIGHPS